MAIVWGLKAAFSAVAALGLVMSGAASATAHEDERWRGPSWAHADRGEYCDRERDLAVMEPDLRRELFHEIIAPYVEPLTGEGVPGTVGAAPY